MPIDQHLLAVFALTTAGRLGMVQEPGDTRTGHPFQKLGLITEIARA